MSRAATLAPFKRMATLVMSLGWHSHGVWSETLLRLRAGIQRKKWRSGRFGSELKSDGVAFCNLPDALRAPEANERPAWKDTVKTYPGTITRVIAKFDLPESIPVPRGSSLRYVWHCHMLEHEDNEMMRPYDVIT